MVVQKPAGLSTKTTLFFFPQEYYPVLKTIAQVGYTVSLTTLIVAFCILAAIK